MGWADVYHGGLTCNWVDVTDVPPGQYTLESTTNAFRLFAESDYDNNVNEVTVTVP